MSDLSQMERQQAEETTVADAASRNTDEAAAGVSGDAGESGGQAPDISEYFDPVEIDALGEIGNICMGTSATTMYALLGRRVTITTPKVGLFKAENVLALYKCPFLAISVGFIEGVRGRNLLILKDYDAALITDLLMGGDGKIDPENIELSELHFSAMSELMNQMIGSAATAMSNMVGNPINISPPQVSRIEYYESVAKFLDEKGSVPVVKVSFDMEIEGLLKSELLQVMTVDMARELIHILMHPEEETKPEEESKHAVQPVEAPQQKPAASPVKSRKESPACEKPCIKAVKQPKYQSFDEETGRSPGRGTDLSNLQLINDIPLQVTVELGKTRKNIDDVLNFEVGSIIVLDKQAGDLVEVIVNGKRFAKGEVVVVDENYGVRITEIIKP